MAPQSSGNISHDGLVSVESKVVSSRLDARVEQKQGSFGPDKVSIWGTISTPESEKWLMVSPPTSLEPGDPDVLAASVNCC